MFNKLNDKLFNARYDVKEKIFDAKLKIVTVGVKEATTDTIKQSATNIKNKVIKKDKKK